jgi:hypothetical protein
MDRSMKYEELTPITREELEHALANESSGGAAVALLRMALHEADWRWAERKCVAVLHDERAAVRAAAVTGLGHVARVHQKVTREIVVPELERLKGDPEFRTLAEDALEDILIFASAGSSECG